MTYCPKFPEMHKMFQGKSMTIVGVQLAKTQIVIANVNVIATPFWPSVGVKPNTSKVGDLESFGTPECLKFDNKAQNTSH
jgi:hypothetical protein